jgi:aminopeptidase
MSMSTFEERLEKYAELTVKVGLNIQAGQTLWINAPIIAPELVRSISRKAYEAGALDVHVEWYDDTLTQLKYKLAPQEAFERYPSWRVAAVEEIAENDGAYLLIDARNPELLKEADPRRLAAFAKATGQALVKFREHMSSDKFAWSIIGAASPDWARMVFPDLEEARAVEALWDAIFRTARVDGEDPVRNWQEHNAELLRKRDYLNGKRYTKLHYRAPGTELTVELPPGHLWCGGSAETEKGIIFNPNMPTEEVFTSPVKQGTNGTVQSTKPLSYQGNLIENFKLTFENGRVTAYEAERGYEILKNLIELDDGSHYLGEIALVPHRSPISETNLIFFNTLYDENASNHLAIGQAFFFCLEGGKSMPQEERQAAGLNVSATHVDFMIGSPDMDIDGETLDGTREPVFRQGNWAF